MEASVPCGRLKKKCWRKVASGRGVGWRRGCKKKWLVTARFFPLSQEKVRHRHDQSMELRTVVGVVKLETTYGQDRKDGHWGNPIRECWGLSPYQQLSPALEDKLAFTVTATQSYEAAAQVSTKWGSPVSDSSAHRLTQRLGAKAEAQTQARLKEAPQEAEPQRAASALGVVMLDGWLARFRAEGWGEEEETDKKRVEWHEIKNGLFYRIEQAGRTAGDRGVISEKVLVRWQGPPLELGRRLYWEALRGGLGRAKAVEVVGDGIEWIWNLADDRWAGATQMLDFWHGAQHVWGLGRAYLGEEEAVVKPWVESRLHQLRHGKQGAVLEEFAALSGPRGKRGKALNQEKNYFKGQAQRMNYQEIADRGWPIGSGAVESSCLASQCRFKRPGQFWTPSGLRHLSALQEARANDHWDQLWVN